MEIKYFSLGTTDNNRLVKLVRILFGLVCIAVAVYWLIFNIRTLKSDGTVWITIFFLLGFGFFQIWSGLGYAGRFIEIGHENIRLKKNVLLPLVQLKSCEMERVEIFPLNVIFYMKSKKRILLRFGTTYHETNGKILDEIIDFARSNNIPFEIIEEKL